MRIHKLRYLLYGFVLLPMSMALADETLVQQELSQGGSSGNPSAGRMQNAGEEIQQQQKPLQNNIKASGGATSQEEKTSPSMTWSDRVESFRNLFNYGYAYTDISHWLEDMHKKEFVETLQETEAGRAFLEAHPIPLRDTLGRQTANLDFLAIYNYAQFTAGAFNFAADPAAFLAATQKGLKAWGKLVQEGETTQALRGLRQFAGSNRDAFVGALQLIDKVATPLRMTKALGEGAKFLGDVVIYPVTDILALTNFLNQLVNDRETLARTASQAYQTPHSFGGLGNAWGAQLSFLGTSRGVTFLIDWMGKKLPEKVLSKSFLDIAGYIRAMTFENFLTEPLVNGAFSWGLWGLGVSDETSSFLGKVSSLSTMWYLFAWNPYILGFSGAMYVATSYDKVGVSLQNMYGSASYGVSVVAESWLGRTVGRAWNWVTSTVTSTSSTDL